MQNRVGLQMKNVTYTSCLFLVLCSFHHVSSLSVQPSKYQLLGGEEETDTASQGYRDDISQDKPSVIQPRWDDDRDDPSSLFWIMPVVFLCTMLGIMLICTFVPCCLVYKRRKAYKNLLVSTTVIHSVQQRNNPTNQVQNPNYPTQNVQNRVLYTTYSNHPQQQHDPNTPYYVSFPPFPSPSAPNSAHGGNQPLHPYGLPAYPPPSAPNVAQGGNPTFHPYGLPTYPPPPLNNTQAYPNEPPPRYLPQETKPTY